MNNAKHYVCGFLLFYKNVDGNAKLCVLLIRKTHPQWLASKWNGIGGLVEPGETAIEAMKRKFEEETQVRLLLRSWHEFCVLKSTSRETNKDTFIHFFYTFQELAPEQLLLESPTEEHLDYFQIERLPQNVLPNVRWLVPMAINHRFGSDNAECFWIQESYEIGN